MSSAISAQPSTQKLATTCNNGYPHPQLEAGLPEDSQGAVKRRFPHRALRLGHWLVRKFNELLIIALIGIPLGQLFLESQQTQAQTQTPELASPERFGSLVVITWIAWVCIATVLALDNFKYLAENKVNIIKAAVAFCSGPTVDRFTTAKFVESNAVYPICLVLAVLCPEIYRLWSPSPENANERKD